MTVKAHLGQVLSVRGVVWARPSLIRSAGVGENWEKLPNKTRCPRVRLF